MKTMYRILFIALVLCILSSTISRTASAERYDTQGDAADGVTVFYVKANGSARIIFKQTSGLCREKCFTRLFGGYQTEKEEWGKYNIHIINSRNITFYNDWDKTYNGDTYALNLDYGTYRIEVIPYTADEMTKSWLEDEFICWVTYPQWWISETINCSISTTPPTAPPTAPPTIPNSDDDSGIGRTVTEPSANAYAPVSWDTKFKPGLSQYNANGINNLHKLTDDNPNTCFEYILYSSEKNNGYADFTANFDYGTVQGIMIRNGDGNQYYKYMRVNEFQVKIYTASGVFTERTMTIPDDPSPSYYFFDFSQTYRNVTNIEIYIQDRHVGQGEYKYVVHIRDIGFY